MSRSRPPDSMSSIIGACIWACTVSVSLGSSLATPRQVEVDDAISSFVVEFGPWSWPASPYKWSLSVRSPKNMSQVCIGATEDFAVDLQLDAHVGTEYALAPPSWELCQELNISSKELVCYGVRVVLPALPEGSPSASLSRVFRGFQWVLDEDRDARTAKEWRSVRFLLRDRPSGAVLAASPVVVWRMITVLINPWWSPWENSSLHLDLQDRRCRSPAREPFPVKPPVHGPRPLFDGITNMLGPQPPPTQEQGEPEVVSRALVVMFAGEKGRENVDHIVRQFGVARFSFVIFIYDHSDWVNRFAWAREPAVTIIHKGGQMKWWYVKQWLHPEAVSEFEAVLVVDEDCNVEGFDPHLFLQVMADYQVRLAQPSIDFVGIAVDDPVRRLVTFTKPLDHIPGEVGRWTTFIEGGPLVAFSREAYPCVWSKVLQWDLASGYGYDLAWAHLCGEGRAAVIHAVKVSQYNMRTASDNSYFMNRAAAEGMAFLDRMKEQGGDGVPWQVTLGSFTDPHSCLPEGLEGVEDGQPSVGSVKIAGFVHLEAVGREGSPEHRASLAGMHELLTHANRSGLLSASTSSVSISLLGPSPGLHLPNDLPNVRVDLASPLTQYYEIPTLQRLQQFCAREPEALVWYLTNRKYGYIDLQVRLLRNVAAYFLLERWRDCVYQLQHHQRAACGALWSEEQGWFAGHAFWASCRQLSQAPDPLDHLLSLTARLPVPDTAPTLWLGQALGEAGRGRVANCWPFELGEHGALFKYQNYYGNHSCARRCAVGPHGQCEQPSSLARAAWAGHQHEIAIRGVEWNATAGAAGEMDAGPVPEASIWKVEGDWRSQATYSEGGLWASPVQTRTVTGPAIDSRDSPWPA